MKSNIYELGKGLGMVVLKNIYDEDISNLKFNTEYQRAIERTRLMKISGSIATLGYWPQEVITINEIREIIDGQHRVLGAKENNVCTVPVTQVTFPDKKNEARFFELKNNWNTSLKPIDFWHARFLSGHPMAVVLYKLEGDKSSLFCEKIAIKGKDSHKSRFYLSDALTMVYYAATGSVAHWTRQQDAFVSEKVIGVGYEGIKNTINDYLTFFFSFAGTDKQSNPILYKNKCAEPLIQFYDLLLKQGFLSGNDKRHAINKMKSIDFTNDFLRTDYIGRIMFLVNQFNSKLKKRRLVYEYQYIKK